MQQAVGAKVSGLRKPVCNPGFMRLPAPTPKGPESPLSHSARRPSSPSDDAHYQLALKMSLDTVQQQPLPASFSPAQGNGFLEGLIKDGANDAFTSNVVPFPSLNPVVREHGSDEEQNLFAAFGAFTELSGP